MTVFEIAMSVLTQDSRIRDLHGQTSEGDKSILPQLLDNQNASGMTSQGSANDKFWSCLSEHGWMEIIQSDLEFPENLSAKTLQFGLTELGRRAIPVVLAAIRQS